MRVAILGLGYVGTVSAACLAEEGHDIYGVDPNPLKVELINDGISPVKEQGLDQLIATNVSAGKLRATTDCATAIKESEVAIICVGTPSQPNGSLDTQYVERACREVGMALKARRSDADEYFVVVVRSTVLPGTTSELLIPTLEETSGRTCGADFGVCMVPEFLREGSAVFDFYNPPKAVVGSDDRKAVQTIRTLSHRGDSPFLPTSFEVAELAKYVDNNWHALKVAFGNEIGRLAKTLDIDSHDVMKVFTADRKLNLSERYLTPGMAFGGSCLPKDVRALTHKAQTVDVSLPVLNSVIDSNHVHLDAALDVIISQRSQKVAILGLSFKPGTDDLREAPMVDLAERLLGKGYSVRIFDCNVLPSQLTGANETFIHDRLPHLGQLLVPTLTDALEHAEIVVLGNADPAFSAIDTLVADHHVVIDMVRIADRPENIHQYEGFLW